MHLFMRFNDFQKQPILFNLDVFGYSLKEYPENS
jgi:hypothetical protein